MPPGALDLADAAEDLHAVEAGHADVQEHEVGLRPSDGRERLGQVHESLF
jgi:hypothetical protein